MRRYLLVSLIVLSACKGKPEHRPPPANLGSAVVATGSGQRAAPDLVLPKGPGTAPLRTTRKLGRADFEKLAQLSYPGFTKEPHGLNDVVFEMRQITNDRPKLWAVVTIEPCGAGSAAGSGSGSSNCWPMDAGLWADRKEELKKQLLAEPLQGSGSDVEFSIDKVIFHDTTLIGTYQLGQRAGSGAGGGLTFTDAYSLNFNDGINKIRVVASYKDDPVASKEMLAKLASRNDLALLALAFLDVYTHAWPTN